MAASAAALREALARAVGPDGLLADPASLAQYAVDGLLPAWVAFPAAADEIGRLLALAAEERLALVPRGSGSLMGLGNLPSRVDLVVDLSRLRDFVAYEPDDLTVSVQCGITLGALGARLVQHRQFLPLDPHEGASRTVGGVLATNGSGPLRCRYGTARDLLLGVRFVQADGTVTWGGSKVVKSVTGYDVPKLMVGSLGTLGVLAEATLRLHPLPEVERTWLATFPTYESVAAFLERVLDSSLEPGRLEFVHGPAMAISFGSVEEAVRSQGESLVTMARQQGGEACTVSQEIWTRLGRALADATLVLKVATLASATVALAGEIERHAAGAGVTASLIGEAGHGVLHVGLHGALPADQWDQRIIAPLRERVTPDGGSVVVERAPREVKERLDVWGPVEAGTLAIMKRLKTEFDPLGVLNPGRFVDRI